jgi:ABC-2 type transport system permease protein
MRLFSLFRKSMREQIRDPLTLTLVLSFAPLIVLVYALMFPTGSTTYKVLVLNQDAGARSPSGQMRYAGEALAAKLAQVKYANGSPMLVIERVADQTTGQARVKNRDALLLLVIGPGFTKALGSGGASSATVAFIGDLTQPYYTVAAVIVSGTLEQFLMDATAQHVRIHVQEKPLGASGARTEFESYVPGLLIFAVILLVFSVPMAVAREVEAGTLRRLQLSRMRSFDFLGAITLTQVIVGVAGLLVALLVAYVLGFRSQGPLWAAIAIGAVASVAVIGVGLTVACFSRTVTRAFLIANFPLAILMFFSGAMIPLPHVAWLTVGELSLSPFDVLPTTHAVNALQKIFVLGAGLGDVLYELAALTVLSATYFAFGVWLFRRTQLRAAR